MPTPLYKVKFSMGENATDSNPAIEAGQIVLDTAEGKECVFVDINDSTRLQVKDPTKMDKWGEVEYPAQDTSYTNIYTNAGAGVRFNVGPKSDYTGPYLSLEDEHIVLYKSPSFIHIDNQSIVLGSNVVDPLSLDPSEGPSRPLLRIDTAAGKRNIYAFADLFTSSNLICGNGLQVNLSDDGMSYLNASIGILLQSIYRPAHASYSGEIHNVISMSVETDYWNPEGSGDPLPCYAYIEQLTDINELMSARGLKSSDAIKDYAANVGYVDTKVQEAVQSAKNTWIDW